MANLGSNDTPIVGESFGLPSGWALTENAAGEVVIEDSGGNVVFRRDETAGEWVTDSIDADAVSVESLIIGGTLYHEDDNSPFVDSSTQQATYNVAGDYEQVILIPDSAIVGHNELRINGDDNENYDYLFNDDTQTSNQTEWEIPRPSAFEYLNIQVKRDGQVRISTPLADRAIGMPIAGRNSEHDEINSVTLLDDSNRDAKFRVFGRSMEI